MGIRHTHCGSGFRRGGGSTGSPDATARNLGRCCLNIDVNEPRRHSTWVPGLLSLLNELGKALELGRGFLFDPWEKSGSSRRDDLKEQGQSQPPVLHQGRFFHYLGRNHLQTRLNARQEMGEKVRTDVQCHNSQMEAALIARLHLRHDLTDEQLPGPAENEDSTGMGQRDQSHERVP